MQRVDKTSNNKINSRSARTIRIQFMIETIIEIVRTQRQIMSEFGEPTQRN